jgi:hypothetical protein
MHELRPSCVRPHALTLSFPLNNNPQKHQAVVAMSGYSYTWRRRRGEDLARASYACERCHAEDQPFGCYSNLERAHLDGDRSNDAPENVAVLCRTCHRRHDHTEWLALYRIYLELQRQRRIDALDAARPILQMLGDVA